MAKARLTGDSQVGGGLYLAGRVAGEALEHAGVVRNQPADLQAPVAALPEAGQPPHVHHHCVFVPGDGGRRHTWGTRGTQSAHLLAPSLPPPRGACKCARGCCPCVPWFLEPS